MKFFKSLTSASIAYTSLLGGFVYSGMKIIKSQEEYLRKQYPESDVVLSSNSRLNGHRLFQLRAVPKLADSVSDVRNRPNGS